jgi:hypothetical protein
MSAVRAGEARLDAGLLILRVGLGAATCLLFALPQSAAAETLALAGPGRFSLDRPWAGLWRRGRAVDLAASPRRRRR